MEKFKDILTTGDVARICKVAPRTVSKWFDTGQLRGYRIPGSRDRRIPLTQLVRFMRAHGMPIDELETGKARVLVVDAEEDLAGLVQRTLSDTGHYEVRIACSAFAAGAEVEEFQPHILLVDIDIPGIDGRTLTRYLASHGELNNTQIIAVGASLTSADEHLLHREGFAGTLPKPFDIEQLTEVIDNTLGVTV